MKPKVIQVRGIAFEKTYGTISEEFKKDFGRDLIILEELDFNTAYKSNKRGCHYDIFLGEHGTIIFRPFHFIDGLDDWCYFATQEYSKNNRHSIEFYQWSSKPEAKMKLWFNNELLLEGSQKKTIRARGNKDLVKNNSIYKSVDFYINYIVGKSVSELSSDDKIIRCVSSVHKKHYSSEHKFLL